MDSVVKKLESADRLSLVCERVGYALWQLQELESSTAQFFVLVAKAKRGMGFDAGNALLDTAKSKTFGQTIRCMVEAGVIDEALESQFKRLLSERNWLVHRSRADSRSAIHHQTRLIETVQRIDQVAEGALVLLREIGSRAEEFVLKHGVPKEYIDRASEQILKEWHEADAI